MRKTITVICAVLLAFSLSACVDKDEANKPQPTTNEHVETTTTTAETTESMATVATTKKSTTGNTANSTKHSSTAKKETTTTTASATKVETTAKQTTTTTTSVITVAQKTTRTATQTELELLYGIAYNKVMTEYYKYQATQSAYINEIESEIADLQDEASALYVSYVVQLKSLDERYANMGLLNSGAHVSAKQSIESQYKRNLDPVSKKIEELKLELVAAKADYESSTSECEALIEEEFYAAVEEFQQKTLS